ncbi:MAG: DNA polymerase III subunit delta' [Lachnospiraceae bacterium]|nr:DNA polymerase III subunit delta' [Lachnospiraceae bacterium]
MTGYGKIIGHENEIRILKKMVEEDRVSHAYLFTGDRGSGKKMLAEAFAEALLCEKKGPEACGECPACRKVLDRNHPDLIELVHEKPGVISVDEVREQVVNTVDIRPYEGGRKVYIIPEAEKMNAQAQNALLKTIEEPPAYTVILLLTSSPEALLPTILSRCSKILVKPLKDAQVSAYLTDVMHLPDYEARVLTAFSQGNLGQAIEAAGDEAFSERKEKVLGLVRRIHGLDTAGIIEIVRQLKEDKDHIDGYLDLLLMWYRDVIYYKASREVDELIFSDEFSAIRDQAATSSYEGLMDVLDGIEKCRVRLRANVNFDLAVELLLFTMKENTNA